jgi:molecular chaperone GrpE
VRTKETDMMSRRKKAKHLDEVAAEAQENAAGPEGDAGSEQESGAAAVEEPQRDSPAPTTDEVIEALTSELQELEDRYLRLAAEFDNFRKRTIRERANQEARAQADLVKQILESLDDLSRVSEHGSTDHDAAALLEGIRLVEMKLRRALEVMGLRPIEAVGQPFDPELHEAMVTVATDKPDENELVSQELAKGYMFKDSLLRPALVQVKMYQPPPPSSDDERGEGLNGS